ncbi:alpha/beta hydrolase [Pseudoalteromonas mariniglutinosa]|uniref:alpha/beta hydrolase n=1 Tax=Pseudoalteromonas mariniglutinosa TaxID=206042 RepID=UPI00384D37D3
MQQGFKQLLLLTAITFSAVSYATGEVITDKSRDRSVPINITLPSSDSECTAQAKCPVAFINAGYGINHNGYTFVSKALNQRGYLTIAVAHELKGDPALNRRPPYMATRMENWHRGVATLKSLVGELSCRYPQFDFTRLTLFGHSNGGDISALYAAIYPDEVSAIITLDHRRMLLPRNKDIRVLTLRSSDYPADHQVLLNKNELAQYPVTQITIEKSRHNDMYDGGPKWLVERMTKEIALFIQ